MGPGPPDVAQSATKISAAHSMCAILSSARWGHSRSLAWVRTSGGVGVCDLHPGAPMPGRVLLHHSRPLREGGGGQGAPVLSWRPGLLALTPTGVAWASSLSPPPPRCAQPRCPRSARCPRRSTALVRTGAGMPDVLPGAAVPNPSSRRSACGALSLFVCRADPKAWQPGVLLRASGLGAALWR